MIDPGFRGAMPGLLTQRYTKEEPMQKDNTKDEHKIDVSKKTKNVATKAIEIVHGERNKHYGHPKDNHGCTATLLNGWLRKRFNLTPDQLTLNPRDVCVINILQKLSRDAHSPKEDNMVDICGYALNMEIVSDG